MQRVLAVALVTSVFGSVSAIAEPLPLNPSRYNQPSYARAQRPALPPALAPQTAPAPEARLAYADPPPFGGGLLGAIFAPQRRYTSPGGYEQPASPYGSRYGYAPYGADGEDGPARPAMDPRYRKQVVEYEGREGAGTIIINTRERFLYLVQSGGTAVRYGIGVGRPGFTWAGVKHVSLKRQWPDWRPPPEMLRRRPDLPTYMAGGPDNPLGARALYLGSSLYRIHGSNEPWTIGTAVSSGCIRMRNEDVIDLYDRVKVGTKVLVI
jgi:lipoprotein-anchoring transpeptidase ErfK/SrfK